MANLSPNPIYPVGPYFTHPHYLRCKLGWHQWNYIILPNHSYLFQPGRSHVDIGRVCDFCDKQQRWDYKTKRWIPCTSAR